jgi:hypothetical protein
MGVGAECRLAHLILQVSEARYCHQESSRWEVRRNLKLFPLSGNVCGLQNVPSGAVAAACQGLGLGCAGWHAPAASYMQPQP